MNRGAGAGAFVAARVPRASGDEPVARPESARI